MDSLVEQRSRTWVVKVDTNLLVEAYRRHDIIYAFYDGACTGDCIAIVQFVRRIRQTTVYRYLNCQVIRRVKGLLVEIDKVCKNLSSSFCCPSHLGYACYSGAKHSGAVKGYSTEQKLMASTDDIDIKFSDSDKENSQVNDDSNS